MQPIIRDSEDEDEEEFLVPDEHVASKPSQQSTNSWMIAEADAVLADNPSPGSVKKDEAVGQSSLSTDDLQRQIADATRGLFHSTSDHTTMKQASMAPFSTPAATRIRRHSAVVGSHSSAKANKRTKTGVVTYGSGKSTRAVDDGQFDAFREEGLPGTLQANFVNHEPAVMFRNTGSTVVDNESSQLRMVEQTINQGKGLSNVTNTEPIDFDKPDSSPFPWAASSVATQTLGGIPSKQLPQDKATAQDSVTRGLELSADTLLPREMPKDALTTPQASPKQSSLGNIDQHQLVEETQPHSPDTGPALNSSPQVSVPRIRVKSSDQLSHVPDDPPQGRNRKASEADLEPMSSDDHAFGIPKELYKPRLSRRRATGITEKPQDFSVIPEKAVKRRRKTATPAAAAPEPAEDELAHDSATDSHAKAMLTGDRSAESSVAMVVSATGATLPAPENVIQPGRQEVRAALKKLNFPLTNTSFSSGVSEKPSPTKDASPLSARKVPAATFTSMPPPSSPALSTSPTKTSPTKKLSNAAVVFAMPPPNSSATRKSRRSYTTIFEDHIDFGRSQQRSPSLRQQQAARNLAALDEANCASTRTARCKRRSIVQHEEGDEDEEDELVKDPVIEAPVPKKRGRPAKGTATKKAPSAEAGLHDSNAEPDDATIEPPKKKGCEAKAPAGKSKSAERVLEDSEAEPDEHEIEEDEPSKRRAGRRPSKVKAGGRANDETTTNDEVKITADGHAAAKPTARRHSATSDISATPPPEKQTPPLTKQDATIKAAAPTKPAAHTPIKTSSKAIHRVGLNRRQRVQPLLKIVRPPAPSKQR